MVDENDLELYKLKAELCKTLSDPKRLMIINLLRNGEKAVGELAQSIETGQAIISRHLSILRERGVVQPRREGNTIYYSLTDPKIGQACDMVSDILINQISKTRDMAKKLLK